MFEYFKESLFRLFVENTEPESPLHDCKFFSFSDISWPSVSVAVGISLGILVVNTILERRFHRRYNGRNVLHYALPDVVNIDYHQNEIRWDAIIFRLSVQRRQENE